MAQIPNKLLYFSQGSSYRTKRNDEEIRDDSIVFVEDDASIVTRQNIFGVRGVYPGTCTTAAGTAAKVATTTPLFPLDSSGKPLPGTTIAIKFSNTNTYKTAGTTMTLNVNNTGAYPIYYNNAEVVSTTSANTIACGYKDRYTYYIFNGTQWVWLSYGTDANTTYSNAALGQGYAIQNNGSESDTVTATLSSYALTTGGIVAVKFIFDVPCVSNPTLNVNAKGAKAIYHNGSPLKPGIIKSGDLATFIYSTNYYLISLDRDFNDPVNVGTLNTNNSTAQTVNSSESFSGNINLHKVSKTGSYNDLTDTPNIPTILTVPITSTAAGGNIVYILGNGIQYANIITVLDNGGEVILKYGDKIYCLSKRENYSLTFSSLQGDDDNYSSFDIDSASRVNYHSGTIITSETVLSKGTPTGSGNAVTDITVNGHQITLKKEETFLKTGDISAWAKASTKPTYTASEVGALPANTHIPVDPVNADWNSTGGLSEILNKPTIVQSVSINGGTAVSPNSTNGNVNLEGIVTGIYWGQHGIPSLNGIVTIPDNIVYGMLDNGLWYLGSYDTETGNWIYSESGSATGELSKIYVNVAPANKVETYIWTGTKFEEVISTSGYATESYVNAAIRALPTPMVFQGTIGTGGTSTTVPSNPTEGDTYKIISGGQSLTFSGITGTIRVGDMVIYKDSTVGWVLIPSGDDPSGTVTSVNMTVPTGLSVSGTPITSSGTLAVSFAAGYSIPTTAKQASWDQKQNAIEIIDLT